MLREVEKYLAQGGIEAGEAKVEAGLIVEHFSGLSIEQILAGEKISLEQKEKIMNLAKERIEKRTPIQYLLGFAYFMGNKFRVNENVLIPRDDTQVLVESALGVLKTFDGKDSGKVLDIGTGSGCIACTLALKCPNIQVLGIDISTPALSVAIENAMSLGLVNRAVFRKSDIFSNIREGEKFAEKFDIIVSNPPYIPQKDRETLQKEVLFEPAGALFVNDKSDSEGLEFYKRIIQDAKRFLNPEGHILFEVGQFQAQRVKEMLSGHSFKDVKIFKDLANIERVLCARSAHR